MTRFLEDFSSRPERYQVGALPKLPSGDGEFDLVLVSYLLFAYEEQFTYEFHRDAVVELMRVTSTNGGEARIYPTVTFEAEPSAYVARLMEDPRGKELTIALTDQCFRSRRPQRTSMNR